MTGGGLRIFRRRRRLHDVEASSGTAARPTARLGRVRPDRGPNDASTHGATTTEVRPRRAACRVARPRSDRHYASGSRRHGVAVSDPGLFEEVAPNRDGATAALASPMPVPDGPESGVRQGVAAARDGRAPVQARAGGRTMNVTTHSSVHAARRRATELTYLEAISDAPAADGLRRDASVFCSARTSAPSAAHSR